MAVGEITVFAEMDSKKTGTIILAGKNANGVIRKIRRQNGVKK